MTRELLTALEDNAECGMRNEELRPRAACGGKSEDGISAAVENPEEQRKPERVFGHRKAEGESPAVASGPQGPDRTTDSGRAQLAPTETEETDPSNSAFEIPNSSLPGSAPDPELEALYRHFERLRAQTQALGREIPDFDPALALRDPDFLRLTAPGVGMDPRRAWLALHPELLERRAARESAAALARSLASSASRPREGGGGAGAALAADYRSLPRAEQQRLKERILQAASRGEKIYP